MNRISIPYAPLSLCLLVMLTAGCQRSVESTVGNAPNLVAWTKSIQDRAPTASPKPLPLLTDTAVFDYSTRSLKSINPNPASALQRAQANGGGSTSPSALSDQDASSHDAPGLVGTSVGTSVAPPPAPVDAIPATASLAMAQGLPGLISMDGHLRDPFAMPITSDTSQNTVRPQTGRPKEALEAFPLDGLKMVGSIGSGADMMALVQASDRVIYHVQVGQYMGEHDGKVVAVTPERIDLMELVPNHNGSWTEKAASVLLSD